MCIECRAHSQDISFIKDDEDVLEASNGSIIKALERMRNDFNKKYDELKVTIIDKNELITKLTSDCSILKEELKSTVSRLDTLEQYSRRNNLEIQGVPEKNSENISKIIGDIGAAINCPLTIHDIDAVHRVPFFDSKRIGPKNIIVKLKSRVLKDNFLARMKEYALKNRNTNTNGSPRHGVVIPHISDRLFVNEHLTPKNKQLYKLVRAAAKEKEYKFTWTKNGFIYTRKTDTSRIQIIRCEEELTNLQ